MGGSLSLLYVGDTSIVGRGKSHQQDCGVKKNILAVEGAFWEPSARTPAFLRVTISQYLRKVSQNIGNLSFLQVIVIV